MIDEMKRDLLILLLILGSAIGGIYYFRDHLTPIPPEQGEVVAKCFLHGMIRPTGGNTAKPSISDMIRLHFDANDRKKCEVMMANYCQFNVREKEYTPEELIGTFKPDPNGKEEITYSFDKKCKLTASDE